MLPSAWILIHILTAEMLVGMFFCAGVVLLTKEYEILSFRKLWVVSLFFAFAAWTKSNVFPYIFLLVILWFSLARWKFSRQSFKDLGVLYGLILLLLLPFIIRNYFQFGDPLYPALAGIVTLPHWSVAQSIALQMDIGAPENRSLLDVFLIPLQLLYSPGLYGSAAPTGLVFLISIVLYFFARRRKEISHILIYVLFCYLAWVFIFRDLRQFFAVLVLLGLMSYSSFLYLWKKSRQLLLACLGVCAAVSLVCLYPVYRTWFPLILPGSSSKEYLQEHLDYYRVAEKINALNTKERILALGETRAAYINKPLLIPTAFDQNPFFRYLAESRSAEILVQFYEVRILDTPLQLARI